jgi:iron(III) transport system substrate-binding protein
MVRDIGWDFYENLAKQNIMQVQSATDPPKKLSLGERSVMADGTEYNIFLLKESGQPVEAVYPTEGTPFIVGPNGIFKAAPNPNAAKLFQNYCFTPDAQQIIIDAGGLRSLHAQLKEHPGRKPLADIQLMKEDAEGAEKQSEEIKARYQKLFHV